MCELQNVIERAMAIAPIDDQPGVPRSSTRLQSPSVGKRMDDIERRHVEQILRETG
jgi:hypothetical protein